MIHYILLTFSFFSFVFTQAFEVQNVTAAQRTDGSHIVDVCYDLSPDDLFISFRVWTELSVDAGENWMGLHIGAPDIMGDNVFPGSNKCFEVSLGDYISNTYSSSAQIKVFAEGHQALELPFEMVPVAAGEFMGADYSTSSQGDGNMLSTVDYDYEIMKYEVTNAEFAQFLIEAKEGGYLVDCNVTAPNPSGLCINMSQTFTTVNEYFIELYGAAATISTAPWNGGVLFEHGSEPNENISAIYWNGTTFIIMEGFADHPVVRVSYFGAWAFANYYGMRIPSRKEWIKAARGMNDWQAAFGPYGMGGWDDSATPGNRINVLNSGDPFDTYAETFQSNARNTTPVGFYNGESNQWDFETIDSPSPYGTYDQTGNAQEWIADIRSAQYGGILYVTGGSYNSHWFGSNVSFFNTNNHSTTPANTGTYFGFRCARTINISD
tara:strand:+ start:469 stop:1776 length:1308 start_codon:yes stop_codon:yes gene_type:complete